MLYEYRGNIHIHSIFSDGGLAIDEIAVAAAEEKLDFIVITDHGTLAGKSSGNEGYCHGVLVLVGMEINVNKNHYLALDIDQVVEDNDDNPQQVINEVNRQKGIGIIAHPFELGSPLYGNNKIYPWDDWGAKDFQGIEIWNFLSQWRDGITGLLKGIYLLFNPAAGLKAPYPETMRKLDYLQSKGRKVFAYGGSDAHGIKMQRGSWSFDIASYRTFFRFVNMHILTDAPLSGKTETDRSLLYDGMRRGRCWVSNDYYWNSSGFQFYITWGHDLYFPGDTVLARPGLRMAVKLPLGGQVNLMKNGKLWLQLQGKEHIIREVEPGVYRLEVFRRKGRKMTPWIYSNPIWVSQ